MSGCSALNGFDKNRVLDGAARFVGFSEENGQPGFKSIFATNISNRRIALTAEIAITDTQTRQVTTRQYNVTVAGGDKVYISRYYFLRGNSSKKLISARFVE